MKDSSNDNGNVRNCIQFNIGRIVKKRYTLFKATRVERKEGGMIMVDKH